MKSKAIILLFLLALTTVCYGQSGSSDLLEIKFKKLRDDIYLAYRPETLRYWVEGNVIIIINDADVVVVDGSGSPRSAQSVIAEIRKLTNKPVRDIRQSEYRKVKRTPPTMTVAKSMRLYRGNRTIEIVHLGAGDTPGDLIVYLPQDRIVCTGDMVTEPVPFGFSRYPLEWLATLNQLSQLEFDTLIPGHGEVQQGKVYLRSVITLLQSVQDQVKAGIAAGLDHEGVRKQVDLSKFERQFAGDDPVYRDYFREYFSDPNVERTFNALKAKAGQK